MMKPQKLVNHAYDIKEVLIQLFPEATLFLTFCITRGADISPNLDAALFILIIIKQLYGSVYNPFGSTSGGINFQTLLLNISSNVTITHSADKKDFRFLPEIPNHKIQISNNI
jgi:hypothetical protein